jgi:hypothetical protein
MWVVILLIRAVELETNEEVLPFDVSLTDDFVAVPVGVYVLVLSAHSVVYCLYGREGVLVKGWYHRCFYDSNLASNSVDQLIFDLKLS